MGSALTFRRKKTGKVMEFFEAFFQAWKIHEKKEIPQSF